MTMESRINKKSVLHFPSLRLLSMCIFALLCFSSIGYPSPQPSVENNVHFCLPLNLEDMRARDSIYAATKHALNLNVGAPRTVRMIYFLPNDRSFRQEVVDSMKVTIRQIQTFYAEQMQARGHGRKTFRFETDARGEPIVHRVAGQYPDSHYLDNTSATVLEEVEQVFDLSANIYLIVVDNSINAIGTGGGRRAGGTGYNRGKNGGHGLVPGGFSFHIAAHELGHGFGLKHDFNDDAYIMSYGGDQRHSLSACHAEFLAVHPYFNPDVSIEGESESGFSGIIKGVTGPFELVSSLEYPAGSQSVPIQLKVSDSDGLHQVILFVETRELHFAAGGLEVKACRGFEGEQVAIFEFDYDGVIPSNGGTSLSSPIRHPIYVLAVDIEGNVRGAFFTLIEISSQLIATLKQTDRISSVAFSPDGKTIASAGSTVNLWDVATRTNIATLDGGRSVAFSPDGRTLVWGANDRTVKLWDIENENITTLEGHTDLISSVAFPRDGTIFASGAWDGTVRLWDITTKQHIVTLGRHRGWVHSVAFSPDGRTLASGGSGDGEIKLWDVATRTNIATLAESHIGDIQSLAFSLDGTILASGSGSGRSDQLLNLWDVKTKQHIATLGGRLIHGSSPVAFSPNSTTLVSGSWDGALNLWDVATKQHIVTLAGHTRRVQSVAFSPDGHILASGSEDATIRLWDVSDSLQDIFSLSLDGDGATGDQAVTSLDISPGSVVSIEVFGNNIQNAIGVSLHFEYDADQVLYEDFEPSGVFPNAAMDAWVTSASGTNPTTINIQSFGEEALADSGLVGRVRFRTTGVFSGTTIRLVRSDLGGANFGVKTALNQISVTLQLASITPDFNADGTVNIADFLLFVAQFGLSQGDAGYDARYDLDGDNTVGISDFLIFANAFGKEGA